MPRLPVRQPTTSFIPVKKIAATTDESATQPFSRWPSVLSICPALGIARSSLDLDRAAFRTQAGSTPATPTAQGDGRLSILKTTISEEGSRLGR